MLLLELLDRLDDLVCARQPALVALAVRVDVLLMLLLELLDRLDDLAVGLAFPLPLVVRIAHRESGEVRVAPGTVPITRPRLRVEGHSNSVVLTNALHDVARNPHVVAAVDTLARSHLVLPLPRHHFRVEPGNRQSSGAAGLVVILDDLAPEGNRVAAAAVIGALRALRLALVREAEGNLLTGLEESVLLLDAEPRLQSGCLFITASQAERLLPGTA